MRHPQELLGEEREVGRLTGGAESAASSRGVTVQPSWGKMAMRQAHWFSRDEGLEGKDHGASELPLGSLVDALMWCSGGWASSTAMAACGKKFCTRSGRKWMRPSDGM
jgi:hypothetical protein